MSLYRNFHILLSYNMALTALLGSTLQQDSSTISTSTLEQTGGVVALYFSAHWCPPCKAYTPKLAEFYKAFKKSDKGKAFDIVFVSSDKDDEAFTEYYGTMPWKALPYPERKIKVKLIWNNKDK